MKTNKLLLNTITLTFLSIATYAGNEGIYIGGSISHDALNKKISDMDIKTSANTTQKYKDVEHKQYNLKIGYQFANLHRAEVYYKKNTFDTIGGDISTKMFGLNYEIGLSQFAAENIVPYVSVGAGMGEVSSNKKYINKTKATEINAGLGVHYQLVENIDLQIGYNYTRTYFKDDKIDDTNQHSFTAGASYKF